MDLEKLSEAIIAVYDNDGKQVEYKECSIKMAMSKYSSTKEETPTLFLDGEPFRRIRKAKITFKCDCGRINTIHLSKFLKKEKMNCKHCAETLEKRKHHSEVLRKIHKGETYIKNVRYKTNTYDFSKETEEFKENFYKTHLTETEFDTFKKYLYSVNDVCVEGKNVEFFSHEKCTNHNKYRQMVKIDGTLVTFQKIKLKCANCGEIFSITRNPKERIIAHNFDCKGCYLNNTTFKVQKIGDNLTFQGKLELNFIKRCKECGISIVNGPRIKYVWRGVEKKYITDFYLPQFKMIIELKDNHIWHKNQVKCGKWGCKENAAKQYAKINGCQFVLLFPNDIESFFNNLEIDSLNAEMPLEN